MKNNYLERIETLVTKEKLRKLKTKKVLVCGVGGVGSFVAEGLARAGVQNFILVDNDTIDITKEQRCELEESLIGIVLSEWTFVSREACSPKEDCRVFAGLCGNTVQTVTEVESCDLCLYYQMFASLRRGHLFF